MKRIPLRARDGSVRAYALVDDTDLEWLSQWRWSLGVTHGKRRAERRIDGRLVRMHRLVMGLRPGDGLEVDHKDGNSLNNQRENLRVVTHAQNHQNRRNGYKGETSRHRGVAWDNGRQKWSAKAMLDGHTYFLGRFDDEDVAAEEVRRWRAVHMPHSLEATTTNQRSL